MKAYITSVGEATTDLCMWSLERNGFQVELIIDNTSLADKLERIYTHVDDDFLRVDADVVVNKNLTPKLLEELKRSNNAVWWWQFTTFDWYKLDIAHQLAYIRKPALEPLRNNIGRFINASRPETEVSRIPELHNPRRMDTYTEQLVGLHGYANKDLKPVMKLKSERGQSHLYDFELAMELNKL
jgi:hypothetical protein